MKHLANSIVKPKSYLLEVYAMIHINKHYSIIIKLTNVLVNSVVGSNYLAYKFTYNLYNNVYKWFWIRLTFISMEHLYDDFPYGIYV